jgi:hypothetical protein
MGEPKDPRRVECGEIIVLLDRYGGTLDRVCKSAKTPIFSEIRKTEKSQKSEK